MRILSARIFLSIEQFSTNVTYRNNVLKRNWRMRSLSASIFSKFFGGKIKKKLNRCYHGNFVRKKLTHYTRKMFC